MNEWDAHHSELTAPLRYGSTATYAIAADFMVRCSTVEDWGCGGGGLRGYLELANPRVTYRGIDGSHSVYADQQCDLTFYRPTGVEGVVLRHVLEHSYNWATILDNAIGAFTNRLCVVLFTPWVANTHVLHLEPGYDNVPVIAFAERDILDPIQASGAEMRVDTFRLDGAHFGSETVIRAKRR